MSDKEEILDLLVDYATDQEAAALSLKQNIAKIVNAPRATISEEQFLKLKYQQAKGEKLGDYEICFKNDNPVDTWQHCFNVLKVNNATIRNHYSPEGFQHYYWAYLEKYDDRFYRKKKAS
jgi:hypothetical protein